MITTIVIVLFYLFVPAIVLRLCHLSKMADKIGAVLICYLVGMVLELWLLMMSVIPFPMPFPP